MEEVTFTRRTIEVSKKKAHCDIKWTDRQRIPRKLKKKYKKRWLLNPLLCRSIAIRRGLELNSRRFLMDFLTTDNGK